MLGQDGFAFIPERQRQSAQTHWEDVRDGRSEPALGVLYGADGSERDVEVTGTVLELQDKQFFLFSFRDVTERLQQARQAAALAQAAATIAASDSIDAVLGAISECALGGTRALAAWVTLDGDDGAAAGVGAAGLPGFREHLRSEAVAAAATRLKLALAAGRVVVYSDWRQQIERTFGTRGVAEALRPLRWQAATIAPLLYQGEAVGVLTAIYREGEMPYAAETSFLAALADQAATATANARLLAAAREKVALEERQRLAMVCERLEQDPAGVAQPIDHIKRLAEASQAEMRALIFALRPEALEREGLVAALNRRIEVLRTRHNIGAQPLTSPEPELPLETKQALHRIGQEALWNTVKHARARRVDVRLEADEDSVLLEVADDGVGFDTGGSFPGHLGLRSMGERAAEAGGSLEVVSARGRGTRVVVRVPSAPPSPPRRKHTSRSLPRGTRRAA